MRDEKEPLEACLPGGVDNQRQIPKSCPFPVAATTRFRWCPRRRSASSASSILGLVGLRREVEVEGEDGDRDPSLEPPSSDSQARWQGVRHPQLGRKRRTRVRSSTARRLHRPDRESPDCQPGLLGRSIQALRPAPNASGWMNRCRPCGSLMSRPNSHALACSRVCEVSYETLTCPPICNDCVECLLLSGARINAGDDAQMRRRARRRPPVDRVLGGVRRTGRTHSAGQLGRHSRVRVRLQIQSDSHDGR